MEFVIRIMASVMEKPVWLFSEHFKIFTSSVAAGSVKSGTPTNGAEPEDVEDGDGSLFATPMMNRATMRRRSVDSTAGAPDGRVRTASGVCPVLARRLVGAKLRRAQYLRSWASTTPQAAKFVSDRHSCRPPAWIWPTPTKLPDVS